MQGGFDVAITSSDGTANSSDYALVTTTLHFAGTVGESHDVSVTIKGDTVVEANETFTIGLGTVTGTTATQAAAITTRSTATGTINNDDSATLTIDGAVDHRDQRGLRRSTFTVTWIMRCKGASTWRSRPATARPTVATTRWSRPRCTSPARWGRRRLSVTIKGDTVVEANETFTVGLGTVSGHHGDAGRGHHPQVHGHRHDHQRR